MDIKSTKVFEDDTYTITKIDITQGGVVEVVYVKLNKLTNQSYKIDNYENN